MIQGLIFGFLFILTSEKGSNSFGGIRGLTSCDQKVRRDKRLAIPQILAIGHMWSIVSAPACMLILFICSMQFTESTEVSAATVALLRGRTLQAANMTMSLQELETRVLALEMATEANQAAADGAWLFSNALIILTMQAGFAM